MNTLNSPEIAQLLVREQHFVLVGCTDDPQHCRLLNALNDSLSYPNFIAISMGAIYRPSLPTPLIIEGDIQGQGKPPYLLIFIADTPANRLILATTVLEHIGPDALHKLIDAPSTPIIALAPTLLKGKRYRHVVRDYQLIMAGLEQLAKGEMPTISGKLTSLTNSCSTLITISHMVTMASLSYSKRKRPLP